ncbi:YeiH family protein [Aminobacterium sp. UBA5514]|uniref:YeiH family protein n=1 Tax=Aminobacterium sp. UBA5514 TaxID=1946036 RepID=UPI00257B4F2B|nr:putative sulfate exporter family transporter [Aminobacterium sp. UBA5514]
MIILQSPYFWIITSLALTLLTKSLAVALCFGSAIALLWGNPAKKITGMLSKYLLQLAVILFGFGLQLNVILKVGYSSIGITFFSISTTLFLGWVLGKLFKVERSVSILISSGTAICGGSAIAAMAPAIGASQGQTAIAMAVVFLLNGIALLVFPHLGHLIGLNQADFGVWAALAIHDTSSVVGATAIYGAEALAIGTTIKLTRALWILPLSFLGAKLNKSDSKAKVPWFLFGFLLAALIRSLFPGMEDLWHLLAISGKKLMVTTLFFVGAGLTREDLKKIGGGSLLKAITLWILVSLISLTVIRLGLIKLPV